MPKTFTAQSVQSVNPLRWIWKDGELAQLLVSCEVNYGTMGLNHEIDILPYLTPELQETAKHVYQFIRSKIEIIILG